MAVLEVLIIYLLWILLVLLCKKYNRILGAIAAAASAFLILTLTIIGRSAGSNAGVVLMPLAAFAEARIHPEHYRGMLMNVLLFVPFGMSLPFVFPPRFKLRVLLVIAAGFLLSAGIELCQWIWSIGRCETIDVVMNTLGTVCGSTAYLIYFLILGLKNRSKKQ